MRSAALRRYPVHGPHCEVIDVIPSTEDVSHPSPHVDLLVLI